MPQNTRNFWIEVNIDGRETMLEGGPRARDGGFSLTIYIRDNGSVLQAVEVSGIARHDKTLALNVRTIADGYHDSATLVLSDGREISIETKR